MLMRNILLSVHSFIQDWFRGRRCKWSQLGKCLALVWFDFFVEFGKLQTDSIVNVTEIFFEIITEESILARNKNSAETQGIYSQSVIGNQSEKRTIEEPCSNSSLQFNITDIALQSSLASYILSYRFGRTVCVLKTNKGYVAYERFDVQDCSQKHNGVGLGKAAPFSPNS